MKFAYLTSVSLSLGLCLALSGSLFCENQPQGTSIALPNSGWALQARISPRAISYPILDGTDVRFSRLDAPQGLSLTKLGPIVQDDQGFLWFGSQHGLYRFDGYSYKGFVHDPANSNSLSRVLVLTLFKDRYGALWVGCDQFLIAWTWKRRPSLIIRFPLSNTLARTRAVCSGCLLHLAFLH